VQSVIVEVRGVLRECGLGLRERAKDVLIKDLGLELTQKRSILPFVHGEFMCVQTCDDDMLRPIASSTSRGPRRAAQERGETAMPVRGLPAEQRHAAAEIERQRGLDALLASYPEAARSSAQALEDALLIWRIPPMRTALVGLTGPVSRS